MLAIKIVQHVHSCAYIAKHFCAFAHTVHVVSWVSAQHASRFGPHRHLLRTEFPYICIEVATLTPLKCGTWGLTREWALAWDTTVNYYYNIVHMKILR